MKTLLTFACVVTAGTSIGIFGSYLNSVQRIKEANTTVERSCNQAVGYISSISGQIAYCGKRYFPE